MNLIITLLTSTFIFSAHARPLVIGPYMDRAQLPESTCLVKAYEKNSNSYAECSSTLISPTKIITAIHCFTDTGTHEGKIDPYALSHATVTCTNVAGKSHVSKLDPEEFMFSELRSQDTALTELESPITAISPMRVATESELSLILSDSVSYNCAVIGYGRDNNDISGNKNGVTLKNTITRPSELTLEFSQKTSYSKHLAVVRPGDSGGSLACRLRDEWVLIGMNRQSFQSFETPDLDSSGLASVITQEVLRELRTSSLKQSEGRVAHYRNEKLHQKSIHAVSREDSRIKELYESGYSVSELLGGGYSIKRIAKKTKLKISDFIKAGIGRKQVLLELIPLYPTYTNPFKEGSETKWSYQVRNKLEYRIGVSPCSTVQTGEKLLAYDADILEIRDDKTNSEDQNRSWFSQRSSAEEYLIGYDSRCLGKGMRKFIEENQVSETELKEIGMSDFVIKKIFSQNIRATKRSPSPKTKAGKKPVSRVNLKR